MPSCVLLSGKSADMLAALLTEAGYAPVLLAACAEQARALVDEHAPALLLCDGADARIVSLCVDAARSTPSAVVLLAKEACPQAEECGVLTLRKPVRRDTLRQALTFCGAMHARAAYLLLENVQLLRKMEELRLVDRAKRTLERVLSMPEKQAHRFIEKQAMDSRQTRAEVAVRILKTYEDARQYTND